jgi:hypothetical protein
MMEWPTRTGKILAWAGIIPFIFAILAVMAHKIYALIGFVPLVGSVAGMFSRIGDIIWPIVEVLISTYTALIVTFIAGSQWGVSFQMEKKSASKVMVFSNIATILAWLGILVPSWVISFVMLIICLWLVWVVDFKLFKKGIWPGNYLKLRTYITIVASVCLALLLYLGRAYY